jgi:hypothetical protein
MHRRLKLIGTLILLACLSGCGFLGTIGGGTGGFNLLGGQNIAAGGAGTIGGIPGFGIPLQQDPPPAQPGGFAGSGAGP